MIALILATRQEAAPFLGTLSLNEDSTAPHTIYTSPPDAGDPVVLLVCGLGRSKAAKATGYLIESYPVSEVINVGLCGALDDSIAPGSLVRVAGVRNGDDPEAPETGCSAVRFQELPGSTLTTVDNPVFEETRRRELRKIAQVVDMEGSAIASICAEKKIPCTLLKGVSDCADARGKRTLLRNLSRVSKSLANVVIEELGLPRSRHGILPRLMGFVRIEHTVFSIPLILAGAWLASGMRCPSAVTLCLLVLAGTGARTLGMAMNRILDRDLDAMNERTLGRDLPADRISLRWAYGVAVSGLVAYLAACSALGRLCLLLSPIPLIALLAYSLFKRFTWLCHFGIGLCMAFGPAGAYVAVTGQLPFTVEILLLSAFTFAWISSFDIIYALQDIDFDRTHGVHSLPARFGSKLSQIIAAAVHFCGAAALTALWIVMGMPMVSGLALFVAVTALVLAYHQGLSLSYRFFPVSAIAGISGSLVVLLGGLP